MDGEEAARVLRSIGSVVAGLFAATIAVVLLTWIAALVLLDGDLSAVPTTPFLAVNLGYSFAAAVLGGWLAARIAAHRHLLHAGIVAAVMLILAVAGSSNPPDTGVPGWYNQVIGAIGAVGALTGGMLRVMALRKVQTSGNTD